MTIRNHISSAYLMGSLCEKKEIQNYKRKIDFMGVNIYWSLILTEDVQIQWDYTHRTPSSRCWKQSTENTWP